MIEPQFPDGTRVRTKEMHLVTSGMGFTPEERRANRNRRRQLFGVVDRQPAPRGWGEQPTYVWVRWDGARTANPVQLDMLERADARALTLDDDFGD